MKKTRPLTIALSSLTVFGLTSCEVLDPEYKKYKEQKKAQAANNNNPYGAPAAGANPYGTPQPAGTPGAAANAPYQPLPGVPQAGTPYPPAPADPPVVPGAGATPAGGGATHTVAAGDTLWGLARKFGTSIEAIQSANGLTSTNIRTGQTLIIPGR